MITCLLVSEVRNKIKSFGCYDDRLFKPVIVTKSVLGLFRRCDYGSCGSECCFHGVNLTKKESDVIISNLITIKPYIDHSEKLIENNHTTIVDNKCSFLTTAGDNMLGCAIHKSIADYRSVKPKICQLFPMEIVEEKDHIKLVNNKHAKCPCFLESRPGRDICLLIYKIPDMVYWFGTNKTIEIIGSAEDRIKNMYTEDQISTMFKSILIT